MDNIVQRVQTALRDHVAPSMNLDPSELEVVELYNGIASIRLSGVCASCPGNLTVLLMGMEQELKKHVPEVEIIEAVG